MSDLADVVAGHGPKRELASDITLYKGVGIALEDVATAAHVYTLARERVLVKRLICCNRVCYCRGLFRE